MKSVSSILLFILFADLSVKGQDSKIRPQPSPFEASNLLKLAKESKDPIFKLRNYLKLTDYHIRKEGQNKTDLDSATLLLRNADSINTKLKLKKEYAFSTLLQAALAKEKGQTEKGKELAKRAIVLLRIDDSDKHLGDAYMELSSYFKFFLAKELQEKIRLVELAASAYQREKRILPLAATQQFLADLYDNNDDEANALKLIQFSLANFQLAHYDQLQGVYIIFSSIYTSRNNYQQALNYGLKALKTAEAVKDTSMQLCQINNIVGVLFTKLKDYKKANNYYKRAFEIARLHHNNEGVLLIAKNMVRTYNSLGQPERGLQFLQSIDRQYVQTNSPALAAIFFECYTSVYHALNRNNLAKPYIEKIIQLIKKYKYSLADLNNDYQQVISFYTDTHQFQLARQFLTEYQDYSNQSGSEADIKRLGVSQVSFKLDSASGNYRSAIEDLLAYNNYKSKVFNESNKKQLKQLNLEYETVKKENQIKVRDQDIRILNQKSELQKTKLEKAKVIRNLAIVCIFVLVITLSSVYNQIRIKRKASSDIARKNNQLEHLLTEKEWLLKEIHHRVKNNLHTVICLLESQATYLENDALRAIESSQHRIYAMSLIHQKLYQSEDVKTIDMAVYIPEFISYLNDSFESGKSVRFNLEIEPIQLGVSLAIPLALIINEAVTNSMKYAFKKSKTGIISISLSRQENNTTLIIADNGIGIDSSFAVKQPESLGLKLMNGLSEDINATILVQNLNGTRITVSFDGDPFDENTEITSEINTIRYGF